MYAQGGNPRPALSEVFDAGARAAIDRGNAEALL